MARIFFIADTHFGHDNIVPMCDRPYMDPGDIAAWKLYKSNNETIPSDLRQRLEAAGRLMDDTLIQNWNDTVGPYDEVWHLGDFHHSKKSRSADYLRLLHGKKHLIRGNHDGEDTWGSTYWNTRRQYHETRIDKVRLVLFHYAMRVWNGSFGGKAIQLFGHSHGRLTSLPGQCDVGVDCWDFRPVTLDQIKERIEW
jgi:calcineurin-like phosphoesterase family protein